MNINNLYFARIDVVLDIDYPDFDKVKYVSKFSRYTIINKIEKCSQIEFYDILRRMKIKSNKTHCRHGEEFINFREFFEPVINFVDYQGCSNVSKRKVMKLVRKKAK